MTLGPFHHQGESPVQLVCLEKVPSSAIIDTNRPGHLEKVTALALPLSPLLICDVYLSRKARTFRPGLLQSLNVDLLGGRIPKMKEQVVGKLWSTV